MVSSTSKEEIIITVSKDGMQATVVFDLPETKLDFDNRSWLISETSLKLKEKGIIFGIKSSLFRKELKPGTKYVIAEGVMPEDGRDSEIRMFELKEIKPEAVEDKNMDYYNLSLITTVDGDVWLGERLDATAGTVGMTVRNEVVKGRDGITFPLYYDSKTVREVNEDGKTVLYSKIYGAVYFKGKEIALMNPLIIDGDVGFKTGNISFDGCVIINGTICDGFYVEAENDIEVNGELGLGNIKGIMSRKGSIFVKGGILSKGGTKIEAGKNVYVKFIENVAVNCSGTAHIGFYCSNCDITAKEVIIDSMSGTILGGSIKAETRVASPAVGSDVGRRTTIEVKGFSRASMKSEVDRLMKKINDLKIDYENMKNKIGSYSVKNSLTAIQAKILHDSKEQLVAIRDELKRLALEKESYEPYLNARGDGEVHIAKRVYPNTSITLKDKTIEINDVRYSATFISQGGKVVEL